MHSSQEHESPSASPAPAKYKGVVPQQNGHWGAQIYVHHSRIWLGTFKSERAAARAYDSASVKLHRHDSHRNFPCSKTSVHEPAFQELFTAEAVLEMIKDGSYEPKLADFVRAAAPAAVPPPSVAVKCRELFQKELTPSDAGKLNRLVIPKKHATRYLPAVSSEAGEEILLEFRDRGNRGWVFRYCYWKSSQSYVFTKGWNKFVKEKGLRAKDVVGFYRCEEKGQHRSYCMIDVLRGDGTAGGGGGGSGSFVEDEVSSDQDVDGMSSDQEKKEMKLFGVWIG